MDSHFPAILAHGPGKFVDRNPEIKAAGNLTNFGDKVEDCLFISEREPYGYVKRYLKPNIYPIGHSTQLASRVNDPCIGSNLCNGISSYPSEPVADLIYPPEISRLESIRNEIIEKNAYPRRKKQTVGVVPLENLPKDAKPCEKTCGKVFKSDSTVYELLHLPPGLMKFCECKNHQIKINRHYNEHFNPNRNFGDDDRPHFEDGRIMKNVVFENSLHEKFAAVPFALEDHRQRNSSKLGECLEPNCDTGVALLDRNYSFGRRKNSEPINNLLNTQKDEYLKTKELLKSIFRRISDTGFNQFDKFLSICSYFDKAKNGKISVEDLKVAYRDAKIPVTTAQFLNLLEFCDLVSSTNTVDYVYFYRIINPKESVVPIETETFERELIESAKKMDKTDKTAEIQIPVLKSKMAQLQSSRLPRFDSCPPIELNDENGRAPIDPILKKIDDIISQVVAKNSKSSMQEIDSDISDIDMKKFRTFGLPLPRSDHPPPLNLEKLGDLTNYGDDSDAYCCLYPSIYTQIGIKKRDMLKSRPKTELYQLFTKVYPNLTAEQFTTLYRVAARKSCDCAVSVEGIRQVLLDLNLN